MTQSSHNFADVTTAELSWHVQNCHPIGSSESKLQQTKFPQVFNHELILWTLWNRTLGHTWYMTPRLVRSSAVGFTATEALISWKAANVLLICKFTMARPSNAGWKSGKKTSKIFHDNFVNKNAVKAVLWQFVLSTGKLANFAFNIWRNNANLGSVRSSDIHLRAIPPERPQPSINKTGSKIT